MLNRKGQSLVLFVLFLPIMLGVMALVVDVGNALVLKSHIDHTIEVVLEITLDKKMRYDDIQELLKYNLDEGNYQLVVNDKEIDIKAQLEYKGVFSKMFGISLFPVQSEYVGIIDQDKNSIQKKK